VMPLLFKLIPSELAPSEDRGAYLMMAKAPNTANLDYIQNNMAKAGQALMKDPAMSTNLALAGIPSNNRGLAIAILKPWSEREKAPVIVQRTNAAMQDIPGVAISSFQFPELPGAGGGLPLQLVITTPNEFRSLFEVASNALEKIKANRQFVYSELDLTFDSATMHIAIDRNKAGAYGVTMQDIATTLSTMMGDGNVNRVSLNGRSYEVIPQVERQFRLNPESIKHYYVQAANGQSIPLNNLVSVALKSEIRTLPHYNQLNSATIGIVSPMIPMGDSVKWLEENVVSELPQGYQHDYMGEARQYVQEGNALMYTFLLALCVIFLVLAAQFESWRDPLVIMMSVPLAISGALVALAWGLSTMNIYTEVGIITLVGLISKHGILICEVAREQQLLKGLSKMDAVKIAARVRLRPILMTTAAMVTGLLPLLGAVGAGALSRFSIGIVIVAGLTIGTFFTLFVLPVIYTFMGKNHKPLQEFDESVAPMALHDDE
jgi:multidrug efflux pump